MLHHWDRICRFHSRNKNIPPNITKICVPNEILLPKIQRVRDFRRWRTTIPITVDWKTNKYTDHDEAFRQMRRWDPSLPITINWNTKKKESHTKPVHPSKEQKLVLNSAKDNRFKTTTAPNTDDVVSTQKTTNVIEINLSADNIRETKHKNVSVDISTPNQLSGSNFNDETTEDCVIQQRNDQISIDTDTVNITIQKNKEKGNIIQSYIVPEERIMTLNNTGLIAVIERNNPIQLENKKFGEFYSKDRQDFVAGNTTNVMCTSNVTSNVTKLSDSEITNNVSQSDNNVDRTQNCANMQTLSKVNFIDEPTKSSILDTTKQYENINNMLKRYSEDEKVHILLYDNLDEGMNYYEKHRSKFYRFTDQQLTKHKEISEKVKGMILPTLDNDNVEDDDSGIFDSEDEFLVINHEKKKEMLIFIENMALFPPFHYLYTVFGYPEYCMGRCPCSSFYHRWHFNTYKVSGMPVPDELCENPKTCNRVFSATGLYQHLKTMKSCKYHESIYEFVKGLYCDDNGDLRIVFKDYKGSIIDLHHDGKYITSRKKTKRKKNKAGKNRKSNYR